MEKNQLNQFTARYKTLGWTYAPVTVPQYLRINTLAPSPGLIPALHARGVTLTKVPWLTHAYRIDHAPFSLGTTTEYLLGHYYLQGAAAQLPVEILELDEHALVLDCSASPGGKTTQIAACMNNTGAIIALEKKKERIARLSNNLERMRVSNTAVYHKDARNAADLGMTFDFILADVPCSGNFTQEPDWFAKRTLDDIARMSIIQKQILKTALSCLNPGSTLVYSTCSLEPEENELVIDYAVHELGAKLLPTTTRIGIPGLTQVFGKQLHPTLTHTRRLWPGETEGFFIARMTKLSSRTEPSIAKPTTP